jgi:hypothetical protein
MSDDSPLPWPSVDFPGRSSITSLEVSLVLKCSFEHVGNLCRSGDLKGTREGKNRNGYRIALADWRAFVRERSSPERVHRPSRRRKAAASPH